MKQHKKGNEVIVLNIEKIRKSKNLTQMQLAEKVGVERSTIAKWELGIAMPTAQKLPKIAEVLECTIDDLFEKEV